jgi:AcrR family transcriptional regulator
MISGAAELLSRRGLEGTSFADVLAATGAPRGSLYHHFPGGKDELVAEAVRHAGSLLPAWLERLVADDPVEVTSAFVDVWRRLSRSSDPPAGCAVAAVTVAAPADSGLRAVTAEVFAAWREALARRYEAGGIPSDRADPLAVTVIAAVEGAIVLSRAADDPGPLDIVERHLRELARGAARATDPGEDGT